MRVVPTRSAAVREGERKPAARALRMPVWSLGLPTREDGFSAADRASERVEARRSRGAKTVHDERDRLRSKAVRKPKLDDVVAYQPVVLAKPSECAKCGAELAEGDQAGLAVGAMPGAARFVCATCMP